jgi:hypothetical protein
MAPYYCNLSGSDKVVGYNFKVPCDCPKPNQPTATLAPTYFCDTKDITFNTDDAGKGLKAGTYASREWQAKHEMLDNWSTCVCSWSRRISKAV